MITNALVRTGGVPLQSSLLDPGRVQLPPGDRSHPTAMLARAETGGSAALRQAAPALGNSIRLLVDEGEVLPELISAIRSARHQIDLTMFSWSGSGAGRQVADLLMEKARRGVEVNVQVDQVGSMAFPGMSGSKLLGELRSAGVRVSVNERFGLREGVQPVDHRKVLAVDGTTFFTGGMNLSAKFGKWHDVMVRVDGPAAARMGVEMLGRWVDEGGEVSGSQRRMVARGADGPLQGRAAVSVLTNKPGGELNASEHLLGSIAAARRRAWVMTPTLSNPEVVDAMVTAARRGVDVRVAISGPEGWIGTRVLGVIGSAFYRDLVGGGVKVYEQPGMSHAKVSLVDDVATVGSMNMTRRAMLWDHEVGVASSDPGFRGQVERLFTTDFERSKLLGPEDADTPTVNAARIVRDITGLQW